MSLYINVDKIKGVLLADGWHKVHKDSFDIDTYEFFIPDGPDPNHHQLLLGGGEEETIPARGAMWVEEKDGLVTIFCPLTSILAVKQGGSK
jgi:hypothetical protein